jgi:hypothetical protein
MKLKGQKKHKKNAQHKIINPPDLQSNFLQFSKNNLKP